MQLTSKLVQSADKVKLAFFPNFHLFTLVKYQYVAIILYNNTCYNINTIMNKIVLH